MRDGKVPGMSVTIVRNDSVIHSKGYGLANLEQQRPMTDSTPVVIGSTSKTITAFAIMQLVDSGKVALDSTVPHYLALLGAPTAAGTQVAKATPVDPRFTAITVRHLLTNVSGIPAGFAGEPFDVLDTATTALEALARDDMLTRPLDFAPGKGYTYQSRLLARLARGAGRLGALVRGLHQLAHLRPARDAAQHGALLGGTVARDGAGLSRVGRWQAGGQRPRVGTRSHRIGNDPLHLARHRAIPARHPQRRTCG
ncbi:MAG: beta-lactamase family protein [Gemmatimonadetes bacterium]|nr:beta-lactamase family protein [Gemmatimonadota bacterium]